MDNDYPPSNGYRKFIICRQVLRGNLSLYAENGRRANGQTSNTSIDAEMMTLPGRRNVLFDDACPMTEYINGKILNQPSLKRHKRFPSWDASKSRFDAGEFRSRRKALNS